MRQKLFKQLFKEFTESEKISGILLIICTIISIVLANSFISEQYLAIWHTKVGDLDLQHWINDGLMAGFFLLIGLELEREIYVGELSGLKKTLLPVSAAMGGMLLPAGIYFAFTYNSPYSSGFGIPMATDIAFAIGIISLVGKRVPVSLKVFLTALAIVDDLGAILIIAVIYSKTIVFWSLLLSLGIFVVLLFLNWAGIKNIIPYLLGGVAMWYFMFHSGVHATLSGVLLAFAIPFRKVNRNSPSYHLQHFLHKPVAYFILPAFALANTALIFSGNITQVFTQSFSAGILAGLVAGKPLGILLFCFLAVKAGVTRLPDHVTWRHIAGAGFLAGIGFTMSIFITLLAFDSDDIVNTTKISILMASLISGTLGFIILKQVVKRDKQKGHL